MKKARGDAKLKTLPDALQEQLWQLLRRTTNAKALEWLHNVHGIDSSPAALSEFFSWYPRQATLRSAASTSDQLAAALKKLPDLKIAARDAQRIAQVNFEIQAAQDRDPALFTALRKGELEAERLRLEREKFEHAKLEDWEKGLAALQDEIKDNPEALKIWEQLAAALKRSKA